MHLKEIKHLISLSTIQKIQDNYSTALGIPISIRNSEGEAVTELSNATKLWDIIHQRPQAEAKLTNILKDSIEQCNQNSQIIIFERHPDTYAFLAPIISNGKIIAYFIGGLVRFGNPNLKIAEEQANILQISLNEYLDAYLQLPLFTKERLESAGNLIKIISNTITTLDSYKQKDAQANDGSQREKKYKKIFNNANDGIVLFELDTGKIVDINQSGADILQYQDVQELIGNSIYQFVAMPEKLDKFKNIFDQKDQVFNWLCLLKNGKNIEINAVVLQKTEHKKIIQCIIRDLSARIHRPL